MSDVTIRPGAVADAAALAAFAERTFADAFGSANRPEDLRAHAAATYGVDHQARELADPSFQTLLAFAGDALVGYAQLRGGHRAPCVADESAVEILRFYVDRPAQGTGLAARLMGAAKGAARAMGAGSVWLGVWEKNPRAIAFYLKAGFRDVGSQVYVVGSDPQTDRVMVAGVN